MPRKPDPVQEEATRAWQAACELYRHIATGGALVPQSSMMVLPAGETVVGEVLLTYSRYVGADAAYPRQWGVAGDGHWRYNLPVPVAVTDRRTLTLVEGRWIEFAHDAVIAYYPTPEQYAFVLTFGGTSPLRLSGPWAPWASLMVAVGVYGAARVPDLPTFAVFREQTAFGHGVG